jgi:hypothetical protein
VRLGAPVAARLRGVPDPGTVVEPGRGLDDADPGGRPGEPVGTLAVTDGAVVTVVGAAGGMLTEVGVPAGTVTGRLGTVIPFVGRFTGAALARLAGPPAALATPTLAPTTPPTSSVPRIDASRPRLLDDPPREFTLTAWVALVRESSLVQSHHRACARGGQLKMVGELCHQHEPSAAFGQRIGMIWS